MELTLGKRLERLRMGDALMSPTGHQIEFVQPGYDYNTVYAVRYLNQVLFLSIHDTGQRHYARKGIDQTVRFISEFDWMACGLPEPESWTYEKYGSDGLLWDDEITSIAFPDSAWLFETSPHTFGLRRQVTIPHRRNFTKVYVDDDGIDAIVRRQRRGTVTTCEHQYVRGRVYEVKTHAKQKTPIGLVQLRHIEKRKLQELTSADILAEGYSSWHDFKGFWNRSKNGKFDMCKWVYTMHFEQVHTTVDSALAATAKMKPVDNEVVIPTTVTDWMPYQLELVAI